MLSIVTSNIITFTRLPYSVCSGYLIYSVETIGGVDITHLLEQIDNYMVANLIKERKTLDYNVKQQWELPEDINAIASDSISLWINNVQMNTNYYTYMPNSRILTVHTNISKNDIIEIEYDVDRIRREYPTINNTKYKIVPIFNNSHKIGQHTVL